jgi:hypothetical protein
MTTWGAGESQGDAAADQPQPSAAGQGQPSNWAPYGQPPPGAGQTQQPWPGWGQPGPVQPGADGFAIASLVLGLLGFIGICAILSVIFGGIALNRISRTQRAGKGMAIAGTVIGGFWLVITIILVITVVASSSNS